MAAATPIRATMARPSQKAEKLPGDETGEDVERRATFARGRDHFLDVSRLG
jgi:hypothetical protein